MQTTRARIVDLLRSGHTATVDDITHALELAPATVRRHLDVLLRDGMVEMHSVRRSLGRPHFVFMLSVGGRDSLPEHQVRLTRAVLDEILSLEPGDTRSCSGRDVALLVFNRLSARFVADCAPHLTAPGLEGRLVQAVEALNLAGLEYELAHQDDAYVLQGAGCPCARLVSGLGRCEHDTQILSNLLGAVVEPLESAESGVAYLVRPGI